MRPTLDARTQSPPPKSPTALVGALPRVAAIGLIAFLALGATACGPSGQKSDAADDGGLGPTVTNEQLGITLSHVPAGFRVVTNEGDQLVLERTDPTDSAKLTIEVGPLQTAGINLVERVWQEKARIEALPDGDYKGQNELGGAEIGTIYTSRGRYRGQDGKMIEEYRALAVHPSQNRLLILDYKYKPTERTGERLTQLMQVIEQIKPAAS